MPTHMPTVNTHVHVHARAHTHTPAHTHTHTVTRPHPHTHSASFMHALTHARKHVAPKRSRTQAVTQPTLTSLTHSINQSVTRPRTRAVMQARTHSITRSLHFASLTSPHPLPQTGDDLSICLPSLQAWGEEAVELSPSLRGRRGTLQAGSALAPSHSPVGVWMPTLSACPQLHPQLGKPGTRGWPREEGLQADPTCHMQPQTHAFQFATAHACPRITRAA